MLYVCSLIATEPQEIPAGGWHVVRFPFGPAESYDAWRMHQAVRQGPVSYEVTDWRTDDRAGLIWPAVAGWGCLTVNVHWEGGGYTELRDQLVRDPLAFTGDPVNTTATDHRVPTPGANPFTKHHEIFVDPGVPLAVRVGHNDRSPRRVLMAQLKLAVHADVAEPGTELDWFRKAWEHASRTGALRTRVL